MKTNGNLSILVLTQYFVLLQCANSLRLLGVFPMPPNSHYILGFKLMKGYAEAGHDVTFISPYETKEKDLPKNGTWKEIYLKGTEQAFRDAIKNTDMFKDSTRSGLERLISIHSIMTHNVNATLYDPNVRALMTSNTKFDAVIMEDFFNDALKYFAHYYKCPLILLSSLGPESMVNTVVANPSPIAYVPHIFYNGDISQYGLTFLQRLKNLYINIEDYIFRYYYSHPYHNELLQQAFPGAPSIDELNKNYASLILLCSHTSLINAVPVVPSMVEIGGHHINPPKPLPNDLQEFLDNAKDGVIYFSMGSNLKSRDMPSEKKAIFRNVFKKLKQKVLWKFEDENLLDISNNVLIRSWLPQQDLLAHPNIKVFITHGGFLSITETIYHGVPVLSIPVFADQFSNANTAVQQGYGLKLPYRDKNFDEETLYRFIQELLNNPIYSENAKTRSKIFHDRPLKPMENALYWLEYVVRHNGAKHLRVAGVDLPLYKYYMLDVLLFLLLVVFVFSGIILFILKKLFQRLVTAKNKTKND